MGSLAMWNRPCSAKIEFCKPDPNPGDRAMKTCTTTAMARRFRRNLAVWDGSGRGLAAGRWQTRSKRPSRT